MIDSEGFELLSLDDLTDADTIDDGMQRQSLERDKHLCGSCSKYKCSYLKDNNFDYALECKLFIRRKRND